MIVRTCHYSGCHNLAQYPNHYCAKHIGHEAEYLKGRERYVRSHDKAYSRHYNLYNRHANRVKDKQDKFYHSKQWQSLRQLVLTKQHYCCQYCLLHDRVTQAKIVDHRVPITFDLNKADDVANLDVICPKCHYLKDKFEAKYYSSAQGFSKNNVPELTEIKLIDYYMNHLDQIPK